MVSALCQGHGRTLGVPQVPSSGQKQWLAPGPGSPVATTCDEHVMNEHAQSVAKRLAATANKSA